MIKYVKGNIFRSDATILVNPVNTIGVMGAGLALQFRQRYPYMFADYKKMCAKRELVVGKPRLVEVDSNKYVMLFPTKKDWRDPSKLEYVEAGLKDIHDNFAFNNPNITIAFPKLGCGLGGLDWETEVKPLMETYLSDLPAVCLIYEGR